MRGQAESVSSISTGRPLPGSEQRAAARRGPGGRRATRRRGRRRRAAPRSGRPASRITSGIEVGAGDQPALDHLPGPRDGGPVDAGRRAPLAVGAQAVDLEVDGRGVEQRARPGRVVSGEREALAAAVRRAATSGSTRGRTRTSPADAAPGRARCAGRAGRGRRWSAGRPGGGRGARRTASTASRPPAGADLQRPGEQGAAELAAGGRQRAGPDAAAERVGITLDELRRAGSDARSAPGGGQPRPRLEGAGRAR